MRPYVSLWGSLDPHASLWIFRGPYLSLSVLMDFYGC